MSATIIAGILAAAGAITSAALNNRSQRLAKDESKELALIARQDELNKQSKEFGLAEDKINLEKEAVGLSRVKTNFEIAQTRKATKQAQLGTLVNALNVNSQKDQNMTNFILSLYGKTGSRV